MRQQESSNIVAAGQDWKECFARDNVLHVDVLNMEWDQIRNSAKCTSRQKTNSRRFSAGRFRVTPARAGLFVLGARYLKRFWENPRTHGANFSYSADVGEMVGKPPRSRGKKSP